MIGVDKQRKWKWDRSTEARSRESENDVEVWNRLRRKWLLEEMRFKFRVKLTYGARRGAIESTSLAWEEWAKGWRSSFGRAFQRAGAWWVNDLSVILSRDETVGRVRVTVRRRLAPHWHSLMMMMTMMSSEKEVHVSDWTWRRLWRLERIERKQDLDMEEIWSDIVSDESKIDNEITCTNGPQSEPRGTP